MSTPGRAERRPVATYGHCDFALSWRVERGHTDGTDLAGATMVLAGSCDDDEPGSPWRVALYVGDHRPPAEQDALADIFLGGAGGAELRNFAAAIGEVHAVRAAGIHLEPTAAMHNRLAQLSVLVA